MGYEVCYIVKVPIAFVIEDWIEIIKCRIDY